MNLATIPGIVDLIVVGAGPAGMVGAVDAIRHGLSVLIVDENPAPGGQIYRCVGQSPIANHSVLGADYHSGKELVSALETADPLSLSSATVWMIERDEGERTLSVGIAQGGEARVLTARSVLVATGSLERPFPIPGWTLPGVITAGAAQTLLKSSGLVPVGPTVLAGSGPLLYLLAAQYARAGVPVAALLDTTPRAQWSKALSALPAFFLSSYAWKGLSLLNAARRSTRVISGVTKLGAHGVSVLEDVVFQVAGDETRIPARTLLLHQGVVPQTNLAMAAGCKYSWSDERLAFEPVLDAWGKTTVDGLFIAGDSGGICGAKAAEASGRLSALAIAHFLGKLSASTLHEKARQSRIKLDRALQGRQFLDRLYRPAEQFRMPNDEVIVCRCEEVTAGSVRAVAARGAQGPNQTKAFLRTGMGPCQGRLCGLTVSEILAHESGRSVQDVGHYHIRNPVKPITLGALSGLQIQKSRDELAARRLF